MIVSKCLISFYVDFGLSKLWSKRRALIYRPKRSECISSQIFQIFLKILKIPRLNFAFRKAQKENSLNNPKHRLNISKRITGFEFIHRLGKKQMWQTNCRRFLIMLVTDLNILFLGDEEPQLDDDNLQWNSRNWVNGYEMKLMLTYQLLLLHDVIVMARHVFIIYTCSNASFCVNINYRAVASIAPPQHHFPDDYLIVSTRYPTRFYFQSTPPQFE